MLHLHLNLYIMNLMNYKKHNLFHSKVMVQFILLMICHLNGNCQLSGFAFSTDSTPIYFRTYGSGKPLLIINGGPGMNSDGFQSLAIELSKNYQTIIYDQRGTGNSFLNDINPKTITLKLMMDDIESLRRHLNLQKWSILGHSFGGMLASYYATLHPGSIDKLILSSSGGIDLDLLNYFNESLNSRLSKEAQDSISYWTQKINSGDTSHHAKLQRGRFLAPAYVVDEKFIPVIAERLTQGNQTINQLIWEDMRKLNFNCAGKLKTFKKPVLIIQGKQDLVKAGTAEKAHQAFVNSKVVYMDHCSHYGWLDNKEVYFKEINTFLKSRI